MVVVVAVEQVFKAASLVSKAVLLAALRVSAADCWEVLKASLAAFIAVLEASLAAFLPASSVAAANAVFKAALANLLHPIHIFLILYGVVVAKFNIRKNL